MDIKDVYKWFYMVYTEPTNKFNYVCLNCLTGSMSKDSLCCDNPEPSSHTIDLSYEDVVSIEGKVKEAIDALALLEHLVVEHQQAVEQHKEFGDN